MAFVLQLDSGGVANANAYIDEAFFDSYHADRGHTIPVGVLTADKEEAIVRATDFLDVRFEYVGDKLLLDQTTEWPRLDAQDIDGRVIFGLPDAVKEATAEYALIALRQEVTDGSDPQDSLNPKPTRDPSGQPVRRRAERVGPISEDVSFTTGDAVGTVFELPIYPIADQKLIRRGLVRQTKFGVLVRGD